MREKDITPEVIKLSKEIAKLWRMEIYPYDLFYHDFRTVKRIVRYKPDKYEYKEKPATPMTWRIPIPSISDCESRLKELGYEYIQSIIYGKKAQVILKKHRWGKIEIDKIKETRHTALLSALLEVLKNEKG